MRPIWPWFVLAVLAFEVAPAAGYAGGHGGHRSTYCVTCPRDSHGRIKRSSSARRRFLKAHGLKRTPKGCQVDHVVPLSKAGKDSASNMQLLCAHAALSSLPVREWHPIVKELRVEIVGC